MVTERKVRYGDTGMFMHKRMLAAAVTLMMLIMRQQQLH